MSGTKLVRYDDARRALVACTRVDEVKEIADQAEALRAYAKQRRDVEMERWVAEIKLRANMRIGELSRDLDASKGGKNPKATLPNGGKSKFEVLKAAGITTSVAHRCEGLAQGAGKVEAYIEEQTKQGKPVLCSQALAVVAKASKRARAKAKSFDVSREYCTAADIATLPENHFGTIYADPPWQYGNQSTRGATNDHYVGLTVEQICELPIGRLAKAKSHLHLWTTNAFLFDAKRVIDAWGFEYKSCYVWVKPQIGMGNYWRVAHEFLLLGVRGTLTFAENNLKSWGEFKRGEHSAKPERIRDLIHKASPGPRLELFARRRVEGWTCWGNEIAQDVFGKGDAS